MKSKVSVEPSIEPVTLAETKEHLRITGTQDDDILTQFIEDARRIAEITTSRKFISQTLEGYTDNLHGKHGLDETWWPGVRVGTYDTHIATGKQFIELDWAPAISITQIDTIDDDNAETVYDSDNYYLDNFDNDMFPRIELNRNHTHPTNIRRQNGVKVTWVAGYGAARTDVPSQLRNAILNMVAHLYTNRGDCGDCAKESGQFSTLIKYKIERI